RSGPGHAVFGMHSKPSCQGPRLRPDSETLGLPESVVLAAVLRSIPAHRHTTILSTSAQAHTTLHLLRCTLVQNLPNLIALLPGPQRTPSDPHPKRPSYLAAASKLDLGCTVEIASCPFVAHLAPENK